MALNFEWDANKAKSNLGKHRISFEEASTVFGDLRSLTIRDSEALGLGKSFHHGRDFASRKIVRCRSYGTRRQYPHHQRASRE